MSTRLIDQIEIVAFLWSQNFKSKSFSIGKNNRVLFEFEDSPELKEAIHSYLTRTARVEPFEFNRQVKTVIRLAKEMLKGVNPNE